MNKNKYRYLILLAAVLVQLCLGATYAWSIFVEPLKKMLYVSQASIQFPFSVFYIVFPFTMIFSGLLLNRFGVKFNLLAGASFFASGWFLAGTFGHHFWMLVLGIGVFGGIGVGLAYIVPITMCIQWFPERKGLVTGIAVAGFGGGSAIVAQIAGHLLSRGWTPFETLRILGLAFFVLIVCGALILKKPGDSTTQMQKPVSLRFEHPKFFCLLYVMMTAGVAAGFAVNANLKQIIPSIDLKAGASAVSIFALCNAAGRIVWGMLFDRFGGRKTMPANLILQAMLLILSPLYLKSTQGLFLFAGLAGFNYGGVLVLYASEVSHVWGVDSVGRVYGLLFSCNIFASLAPVGAGVVFDWTGNFDIAFISIGVGIGMVVAGFFLLGRNWLCREVQI